MCRCGNTFTKIPANKKHCSVTCSRKHDKETRQKKWVAEQHGMAGKSAWKPTLEQLKATEAVLIAMGVADGKTFHGVGELGMVFIPSDLRVLWMEAAGEQGTWNMVFVP